MIWEPDAVALTIGGAGVRFFSIYFVLAFIFGYALFSWQILRAGGTSDEAIEFVALAILGSIIGGRVGAIVFDQGGGLFDNPMTEMMRGGFSLHGCALGLILVFAIYARQKGLSLLEVCDRFSFAAASSLIMVSLAQLFESQGVGRIANPPWAMRFPLFDTDNDMSAPLRHPAQFYELVLTMSVLLLLWGLDRFWKQEARPRGALTGAFLSAYFAGHAVVELFREAGSSRAIAGVTLAGLLCIPVAMVGVLILVRAARARTPAVWEPAVEAA
jgi:phosphatidylglycerol---prolipoprotein diacylglyceryl transferase